MAKNRRLMKEFAELQQDSESPVKAETFPADPADLTHLKGTFYGPPDTPYEGGKFDIDIVIPNDYPFKPPKMRFLTRIWHPNVSSQTGAICLDTLGAQWSPILTLKSALISVQSLLSSPEPRDPQDAEVAKMLLSNPKEFEHKAREWAVRYAGAPKKERGESSGGATAETLKRKRQQAKEEEKKQALAAYHGYDKRVIDQFVEMGFEVPVVVEAFEFFRIDKHGGQYFDLEPEYAGDVTARLFGEA